MQIFRRSPWLSIWLLFVLGAGLSYSFAIRSISILPGENLLMVGMGLIVAAGVVGSARTGKWFTWDGRVIPNRLEWRIGLTGAVLFISPLLHVFLVFVAGVCGGRPL